jgi:esterase/lipase
MRRSLLLASLAALLAARHRHSSRLKRKTWQALDHFTSLPALGMYEEAWPQVALAGPRLPHAVLLLHGFSASPYELEPLTTALKRAGISYYAPLLTGHGLSDFHLLAHVEPADWLRDAIHAYDLLAVSAEQISICGHSTGATLAVYVAQRRAVQHLVLSAPNLFPSVADRPKKAFLELPGALLLLRGLSPLVAKPVRPGRATWADIRDPAAAKRGLSYAALPPSSIHAQWSLQDQIDIRQASYRSLTIAYGAHDLTVDTGALLRLLDDAGLAYTARSFPASGHNILQDYDKQEAVTYLVATLQGG